MIFVKRTLKGNLRADSGNEWPYGLDVELSSGEGTEPDLLVLLDSLQTESFLIIIFRSHRQCWGFIYCHNGPVFSTGVLCGSIR